MRPEDLRPATAQAALKKKHKLEKRLSPGEKKNRKRMASVASVYSIARDARTPCLVAQGSYRTEHKKPKPVGKRVWASIEKPVQRVIYEIFEEAERQDPEHQREWVALVDGNKQQIELLEKEAKQRCIRLCIVLDVMHVLEYIWKAAYAFYPVGSPQAQSWVNEKFKALMQGKSSQLAASMRRAATGLKLSAKAREPVDSCAQYLLNHKPNLRYHQYLNKGYPIATGVIEGACRHLVKDRMDRTGARWSLKGAEAVLKMRALLSSGDFEQYWEFHEQKEQQRNYVGIRNIFSSSGNLTKMRCKSRYDKKIA